MLYANPSLPLAATCLLLSAGIWYLLFVTPLVPHLAGRLAGTDIDSHEDLCAWLNVRGLPRLAWLSLCLPCQVCWTAGAALLLYNLSAGATPLGWLSFPIGWLCLLPLAAAFLKLIKPL